MESEPGLPSDKRLDGLALSIVETVPRRLKTIRSSINRRILCLLVVFGIGLAMLIECYRKSSRFVGLGLGGAIAINLCGGFVLAVWAAFR